MAPSSGHPTSTTPLMIHFTDCLRSFIYFFGSNVPYVFYSFDSFLYSMHPPPSPRHSKNTFYASGPKLETVADFWRMIWEQKTATIVMLTNLKERKEVSKRTFITCSSCCQTLSTKYHLKKNKPMSSPKCHHGRH